MKKLKIITVGLLIGTLFLTSCSKKEDLPTPEPVGVITNDESNITMLEFDVMLTTFNIGSDVEWIINEGNCIVKSYYTSNGDTLESGVNYNYPIYDILDKHYSTNISFGCGVPSDTLQYHIYPNNVDMLFHNEMWTIVNNNDSVFEFYRVLWNRSEHYKYKKI